MFVQKRRGDKSRITGKKALSFPRKSEQKTFVFIFTTSLTIRKPVAAAAPFFHRRFVPVIKKKKRRTHSSVTKKWPNFELYFPVFFASRCERNYRKGRWKLGQLALRVFFAHAVIVRRVYTWKGKRGGENEATTDTHLCLAKKWAKKCPFPRSR